MDEKLKGPSNSGEVGGEKLSTFLNGKKENIGEVLEEDNLEVINDVLEEILKGGQNYGVI